MTTDNEEMQDAEWNPGQRRLGRYSSRSVQMLRSLKPGDTKRLLHSDVKCKGNSLGCTLYRQIQHLRVAGWEIEHYHEAAHIIVIRRVK